MRNSWPKGFPDSSKYCSCRQAGRQQSSCNTVAHTCKTVCQEMFSVIVAVGTV